MAKVDGTWNCTVSSPMGPQASTMTLTSDGDRFTGANSGPLGSIEIEDGRIDGDAITFAMALTVPMKIRLDCEAKIDGDKMTGTVTAGIFGSWPITATRA